MNELWNQIQSYVTPDKIAALARSVVLVVVGLFLARVLSRVAQRLGRDRIEASQQMLLRRVVFYGIAGLFIIAALHELGFNLSVLLGAAGVLSVAIGFASQTSASNLVSGLFLIGERAFEIGDVIQIGGTTGEVLSIDLLSVKLRTFDNLYVRIPNETLVKSEVRTLTKFPIRRLDLTIGIAYKEDIARVETLLLELAERNPVCLDEPKPLFLVLGFGDSSVDLQFSPWSLKENFVELRNTLQREIKEAFDDAGIEIPFPHRALVVSHAEEPLSVRVTDPTDGESS